uniref:Glucose-6-phosphate 1-dehydrogenase n=1 Tax=Neospora caninum (strain Liverpool) TaxID=572307 RepID=A0A0F7U692_NEOCL|nr:TPA: Glucose-6-phosphate dehydrogenase, putative [Neospora caninum Liverpool]
MVQHRIKACAAYLRHLWLLAAMTAASVLVTNVAAGTAGRDRTSGYVNVGSGSDNVTFVFYGATGDLCRRKLYPTVFQLFLENKLPEAFFIVGMSNQDMSLADFRKMHRPQLEKVWSSSKQSVDPARGNLLKQFEGRMSYTSGSIDDDNVLRPFCHKISKMELLRAPNSRWGRLLYLALPPHIFAVAAAGFKRNCSAHESWTRVVVEKPFGRDSESSELLAEQLRSVLREEEIYRIDHYLGKEMLLALPPLRFTNTFLEPLLNRNYVKEIVISFNEDIGISGRGEFFDAYGIIRDVMQNHLLQLLTLVVMERPATLSDEDIRDEKVKVLKQIDPISLAETVVGQYAKSEDGSVASYLETEGVPSHSRTPTYAAVCLHLRSPRWEGVPIFMEAGKGMGKKTVYVRIKFAGVPGFRGSTYDYRGDSLILEIQPHPSVRFEINAKAPGAGLTLERDSLKMDVTTDGVRIPDAYENLLSNVLRGDKSQFVRTDELRESWRIFTPMLHQLEEQQIQPRLYAFGSPGPSGAMHELRSVVTASLNGANTKSKAGSRFSQRFYASTGKHS